MDKAVIFIVEGATDKKALENIFKKIYKYKEIHFEFTHGDTYKKNYIPYKDIQICTFTLKKIQYYKSDTRSLRTYSGSPFFMSGGASFLAVLRYIMI